MAFNRSICLQRISLEESQIGKGMGHVMEDAECHTLKMTHYPLKIRSAGGIAHRYNYLKDALDKAYFIESDIS